MSKFRLWLRQIIQNALAHFHQNLYETNMDYCFDSYCAVFLVIFIINEKLLNSLCNFISFLFF